MPLAKQTDTEVLPPLPVIVTAKMFLPIYSLTPADYTEDDELRLESYFQLARSKRTKELSQITERVVQIRGSSLPLKT